MAIIGIVAALTIPSVMANYKRHELQTQFKKAYNTISQAGMQMRAQGIAQNFIALDLDGDGEPTISDVTELQRSDNLQKYYKLFKTTSKVNDIDDIEDDDEYYSAYEKLTYKNFIGSEASGQYTGVSDYIGGYNLTDGSWIRILQNGYCLANGFTKQTIDTSLQCFLYVTVDINGINKKPNKEGYDVFHFEILPNGNVTTIQKANCDTSKAKTVIGTKGVGKNKRPDVKLKSACFTAFALADKSPEDLSKKYFKDFLKF